MNKITQITRRNIFDAIIVEGIKWSGRLQEPDFLNRIFNLSELPSYDGRFKNYYGDIWQHRINNYDWEEDWIFSDSTFDLLNEDDSIFLQFLCEMVHPIVRSDLTEVNRLKQIFNEYLSIDGFEIIEKTQISGRPVFASRKKLTSDISIKKRKDEIINFLTEDYVTHQISIMEGAIETAPHLAIGTAKELIETICKTILKERNISFDKNWDLPKLVKETNKELKLTPKDIPEEAKAVDTIRTILGSLSTVVHGICELRNHYGTGHGKDSEFKGLGLRHVLQLQHAHTETLKIVLPILEYSYYSPMFTS